jgi:hypothetical protein
MLPIKFSRPPVIGKNFPAGILRPGVESAQNDANLSFSGWPIFACAPGKGAIKNDAKVGFCPILELKRNYRRAFLQRCLPEREP